MSCLLFGRRDGSAKWCGMEARAWSSQMGSVVGNQPAHAGARIEGPCSDWDVEGFGIWMSKSLARPRPEYHGGDRDHGDGMLLGNQHRQKGFGDNRRRSHRWVSIGTCAAITAAERLRERREAAGNGLRSCGGRGGCLPFARRNGSEKSVGNANSSQRDPRRNVNPRDILA